MRYLAKSRINSERIKQILLYDTGDETYMFPFASLEDGSANGDYWFEDLADAKESCRVEYGIVENDWQEIEDPLEFCQHDWIAPVRVIGRAMGTPQFGRLEILINGEWVELLHNERNIYGDDSKD